MTDQQRETVRELCRRFGVQRLELFGSAATDRFEPDRSDVDLLVDFTPESDLGPWMCHWFELQSGLAVALGRPVDLVMVSALRNPWFRREAAKTTVLLYHASQEPQVA